MCCSTIQYLAPLRSGLSHPQRHPGSQQAQHASCLRPHGAGLTDVDAMILTLYGALHGVLVLAQQMLLLAESFP